MRWHHGGSRCSGGERGGAGPVPPAEPRALVTEPTLSAQAPTAPSSPCEVNTCWRCRLIQVQPRKEGPARGCPLWLRNPQAPIHTFKERMLGEQEGPKATDSPCERPPDLTIRWDLSRQTSLSPRKDSERDLWGFCFLFFGLCFFVFFCLVWFFLAKPLASEVLGPGTELKPQQ